MSSEYEAALEIRAAIQTLDDTLTRVAVALERSHLLPLPGGHLLNLARLEYIEHHGTNPNGDPEITVVYAGGKLRVGGDTAEAILGALKPSPTPAREGTECIACGEVRPVEGTGAHEGKRGPLCVNCF